jgi:purine-nucleoside phosphorylase
VPQIHLHAEPGDFAPVVLLPGDPNRATRIAARFDGGLEGSRLVTEHRGLLGYTGTLDGVPVSVQTTMMGTPTTSIVVEELLMLGVTTFIRVGTTGGFPGTAIGDAVIALAAAANTGVGHVLGGGEMEAAAVFLIAMRERGKGRPVRAGCILTVSDVIRDPDAEQAVGHEAWFRPPEDEVTRRVDLTVGAALAAAAALGRSG